MSNSGLKNGSKAEVGGSAAGVQLWLWGLGLLGSGFEGFRVSFFFVFCASGCTTKTFLVVVTCTGLATPSDSL